MNEEELYKLALSDVPKYSLLNEILAIRDKRFPNEEADYCVNVNGYISLDVLNEYVKIVQENQQLKEKIELLNQCIKTDKDKIDYWVDKYEELQKRIEKAIEYIENNRNTCYMDEDITYLLITLKGEEK